mmetsp:Transcript_16328/g.27611  ORF Transcript_16328/g.27611 Transcript_16328/m.27611 type:complete len:196 (+) Transcript_16328:445-1032(+)
MELNAEKSQNTIEEEKANGSSGRLHSANEVKIRKIGDGQSRQLQQVQSMQNISNTSNRVSPAPSVIESEDQNKERAAWDRHSYMPPQMMKRWFGGRPMGDQEIINLFKQDLEDVGQGAVRNWLGDRDGRLAIIILCDQLSRSIFRGMAEAFSFDHISLKLSKHLIGHKDELRQYKNFEKLFIIMPLMHSEDLSDC